MNDSWNLKLSYVNQFRWIIIIGYYLFIYLFIVSLEVYQRYVGSTYSLTSLRWGVFLCGPCLHFIFYWQICSFVLKHFEKFPSVFVKNLYRCLWISFSKGGSFHLPEEWNGIINGSYTSYTCVWSRCKNLPLLYLTIAQLVHYEE
jgi:hypothetical protein